MIDEERVGFTDETSGWKKRQEKRREQKAARQGAGGQGSTEGASGAGGRSAGTSGAGGQPGSSGADSRRGAVTKLERRLELAVGLLEIVQNFMVVFCLEAALDAIFGTGEAVWKLWLPLLLPVIYYFARKYIGNFGLFMLVHLAAMAALLFLAGRTSLPLLWGAAWVLLSLLYIVISIKICVTGDSDAEGELHPMFCAVAAVALFLLCGYAAGGAGCDRILWMSFCWILLFFLKKYMENFLGYVEINRSSSGVMPEKGIFRSGFWTIGIYSVFSVLLLILCAQTPLIGWLSSQVKRGMIAALRLFFQFLSLFGAGEEEEILESAAEAQEPVPDMFGAEVVETPFWMELLEKILIAVVTVALIAGVIAALVLLIRYIIRGFYGRQKEKIRTQEADFLEEEERLISTRRERKARLPVIGGTPDERVRRIFKKTVRAAVLDKEKTAVDALTARELMALAQEEDRKSANAGTTRTDMKSAKTGMVRAGMAADEAADRAQAVGCAEEWTELVSVYERARYAKESVTREDVAAVSKLSRRILHTIR